MIPEFVFSDTIYPVFKYSFSAEQYSSPFIELYFVSIIFFPCESSTPYSPSFLTNIHPGLFGRLATDSYIASVNLFPS